MVSLGMVFKLQNALHSEIIKKLMESEIGYVPPFLYILQYTVLISSEDTRMTSEALKR